VVLEKHTYDDPEKAREYGKAGFGALLLILLIIGVFRPAVLSGIPILWAVIVWLGGIQIIAGVTGLVIAILANMAYILWEIPVSLAETVKKIKQKLT